MSRILKHFRPAVGLFLTGCFISGDVGAARRVQATGDGASVRVVGGFSNVRYTAEHAYGYQLELWRSGGRLVGLFMFTDGPQADFHTGLLESLTFDSATRRLSFEAYVSQFRFDGRLDKDAVTGRLVLFHPESGQQVGAERVRLRRSRQITEGMREYASSKEWKQYADGVLKRLGPRRPKTPLLYPN